MRIADRTDHGIDDTRSTHLLDPADDLARLGEAIDESVVANEYLPNSAALLAICVSNLPEVKRMLGDRAVRMLITEIEKRLKKVLRGSDVIGRLNEDQFGIVLSRCGPENILTAARRFLAAAAKRPVIIGDSAVEVMLSTASVPFPDEDLISSDDVIARAETRLLDETRSRTPTPACFNDGNLLG
jgi:GGDEF domain-containing protein